jgi:hypothetical protein
VCDRETEKENKASLEENLVKKKTKQLGGYSNSLSLATLMENEDGPKKAQKIKSTF